jgi:hypothetical protein
LFILRNFQCAVWKEAQAEMVKHATVFAMLWKRENHKNAVWRKYRKGKMTSHRKRYKFCYLCLMGVSVNEFQFVLK